MPRSEYRLCFTKGTESVCGLAFLNELAARQRHDRYTGEKMTNTFHDTCDTSFDKYSEYLETHIANVQKAYEWLKENTSVSKDYDFSNHDASKYSKEEFEGYAEYFYGSGRNNIYYEWLHHIHHNPHHWEYWVLPDDEERGYSLYLPMPEEYIVEMICDWMSFGIAKNDPYELFDYWKVQQSRISIHPLSLKRVAEILGEIRLVLDAQDDGNNKTERNL